MKPVEVIKALQVSAEEVSEESDSDLRNWEKDRLSQFVNGLTVDSPLILKAVKETSEMTDHLQVHSYLMEILASELETRKGTD